MRIISGIAKGRKILSPEGNSTRPTLDRIKESIFNIIQADVYGSLVIDMFSGTGSLGLEAASRGAKHCYLFDKGEKTYSLLKENVIALGFEDICTCYFMNSYEGIKILSKTEAKFDLIFIDPPYFKEMIPPAIELIDEINLLSSKGLIVTKIDSGETIYSGSTNIKLTDSRKYGNTTVCFYKNREG